MRLQAGRGMWVSWSARPEHSGVWGAVCMWGCPWLLQGGTGFSEQKVSQQVASSHFP